jgi:hypothetical protein
MKAAEKKKKKRDGQVAERGQTVMSVHYPERPFEGVSAERVASVVTDFAVRVVHVEGGQPVAILYLPLVTDVKGWPVEQVREFEQVLSECAAIVSTVHEQIGQNRQEIERLGAETRELLSKLKAA